MLTLVIQIFDLLLTPKLVGVEPRDPKARDQEKDVFIVTGSKYGEHWGSFPK